VFDIGAFSSPDEFAEFVRQLAFLAKSEAGVSNMREAVRKMLASQQTPLLILNESPETPRIEQGLRHVSTLLRELKVLDPGGDFLTPN
jgi:hypothetical protein